MTKLVQYDAACRALAMARRVDEVKKIRDQAVAVATYARLAKDKRLLVDATQIKERAERRGGQIMEEQRRAGELKRGRPKLVFGKPISKSLKKQGVDQNLANRMRKKAAMKAEVFERHVARSVAIVSAAADDNKAVVTAARAERHREKKKKRDKRERELGVKLMALPQKRYGVILADPEWKFKFFSEKGKTNSSADNHYETSELDEIKARDVGSIAAPDSVLFLWATAPMLPQALEVMAAWGFIYKTNASWDKLKAGTG